MAVCTQGRYKLYIYYIYIYMDGKTSIMISAPFTAAPSCTAATTEVSGIHVQWTVDRHTYM